MNERILASGNDETPNNRVGVGFDQTTKPSRFTTALIVLGILLCLLMGALDNFVVLTALSKVLQDLKAPLEGSTFIFSAYLISSTIGVPIFAKLSDLFDRKKVFIGGLLLFMAGSILAGLSQNFSELVIFRAIQGFGSGDFFPVGLSIVAIIFPPETRARITGLLSGVFGIATVAGPLIGSAIVDNTTWRWVFYVNIPVGIVGLAIILTALRPMLPEVRKSLDLVGIALLAGWVAALMFPLVEVSQGGWAFTDERTIILLASAVVSFVAFVFWEIRNKDALVPLRLLSRRIVAACGSTTFLVGATFFPLATFITVFVTGVHPPGTGANVSDTTRDMLYAMVIPVVIGAALSGNLLRRIAYRPVVLAGISLQIIGLFFLMGISATTPVWKFAYTILPVGGIVLPLIPLGFGVGLTFPVFLLAVQNQVPKSEVGAASGLVQFLQSLGGSIALSLISYYQQVRLTALDPVPTTANCPVPPASTQPPLACVPYYQNLQSSLATSYDNVFSVVLVIALVAFVAALFISGRLPKGARAGPSGGPA